VTAPCRVQVSPEARAQVATINLWWAEHRPAAPTLVAAEFEAAVKRLATLPACGRPYPDERPGVRKLLMPRSGYHLYYEVHDANRVVTVLAVWHVARGQGPPL
jgi:plasmid stabilization system protein ParE